MIDELPFCATLRTTALCQMAGASARLKSRTCLVKVKTHSFCSGYNGTVVAKKNITTSEGNN